MNINVVLAEKNNHNTRQQVYSFLVGIDQEFVPPLSGRGSSVATDLAASFVTKSHHLGEYVDEVLRQMIVFAQIKDQIVGLFSFKPAYSLEAVNSYNPCNYITTVGVHPDFRNRGVSRAMYHFALDRLSINYPSPYWVTRTWSTNAYHLKLLDNLGFNVVKVLENDRGNAIDTLYLALPVMTP